MLFLLNAITIQKIPLHLKLTEYVSNDFLFHARSLKLPHKKSASFCSQHLLSFAPISSGHVLPLAAGDGGTSYLRVAELTLKPQNIALWALFFSA